MLGALPTAQLIAYLTSLGVRLWLEGERLRFSAPTGALKYDLLEQLTERKQEICRLLRNAQTQTK